MTTPTTPGRRSRVRTWLKTHGHDKNRVDQLPMATEEALLTSLLEIHGVTEREYESARRVRGARQR